MSQIQHPVVQGGVEGRMTVILGILLLRSAMVLAARPVLVAGRLLALLALLLLSLTSLYKCFSSPQGLFTFLQTEFKN